MNAASVYSWSPPFKYPTEGLNLANTVPSSVNSPQVLPAEPKLLVLLNSPAEVGAGVTVWHTSLTVKNPVPNTTNSPLADPLLISLTP